MGRSIKLFFDLFLFTQLHWAALASHTPVTALAFAPDGSQLLISGHKRILVRSMSDTNSQSEIKSELARITCLVFSPDGRTLAVGGGSPGEMGSVEFFSWPETGQSKGSARGIAPQKRDVPIPEFEDLVTAVSFSRDGTRLAVASADHTTDVFKWEGNGAKLKRIYTLLDHSGPVLAAGFSFDEKVLVTASADRSLKVWDVASGKALRTFSHHTAIVHCIAFRPRGESSGGVGQAICASGSDDKTVRIWQPEIGRMVRIVRYHDGPILALAYSRDGARLFSAGSEGIVRVIDSDSDEILHKWQAHDDWIYALALSPDGHMLATGDWSGVVKVWDVNSETYRLIVQWKETTPKSSRESGP